MMLRTGLKLAVAAGTTVACLASNAMADLYVVRVGTGSAALTSASTAAFVEKFADSGGSPTSTITLPTAGGDGFSPLTLSGSSTSEGFLTLSTNGQYLTLGGYGTGVGTLSVPQTSSTVVNRVIGRIEVSSGIVDTSTALTDAYDADGTTTNSNIRSVASSDGTKFWSTGTAVNTGAGPASAGIRYSTLGSTTSTQLSASPTNLRVANIFGGDLYVSSASGAFQGVSQVGTDLPTDAGQTITLLSGFPTAAGPSSYDFWFKDASTLYVADDRTIANGGGIQKWTESSGTWSLAYTLAVAPVAASNSGARGLAGAIEGTDTVLYATTSAASANRLVKIVDTGASSAYVDLATAATNTVFRGVEFVSSSTPVGLPGDFNGDEVVDAADYTVWRDNLGGDSSTLNGNGTGAPTVVPADYDLWKASFGDSGSGGIAGSAVPEPVSVVLVLFGMAGLAAGRRRVVR